METYLQNKVNDRHMCHLIYLITLMCIIFVYLIGYCPILSSTRVFFAFQVSTGYRPSSYPFYLYFAQRKSSSPHYVYSEEKKPLLPFPFKLNNVIEASDFFSALFFENNTSLSKNSDGDKNNENRGSSIRDEEKKRSIQQIFHYNMDNKIFISLSPRSFVGSRFGRKYFIQLPQRVVSSVTNIPLSIDVVAIGGDGRGVRGSGKGKFFEANEENDETSRDDRERRPPAKFSKKVLINGDETTDDYVTAFNRNGIVVDITYLVKFPYTTLDKFFSKMFFVPTDAELASDLKSKLKLLDSYQFSGEMIEELRKFEKEKAAGAKGSSDDKGVGYEEKGQGEERAVEGPVADSEGGKNDNLLEIGSINGENNSRKVKKGSMLRRLLHPTTVVVVNPAEALPLVDRYGCKTHFTSVFLQLIDYQLAFIFTNKLGLGNFPHIITANRISFLHAFVGLIAGVCFAMSVRGRPALRAVAYDAEDYDNFVMDKTFDKREDKGQRDGEDRSGSGSNNSFRGEKMKLKNIADVKIVSCVGGSGSSGGSAAQPFPTSSPNTLSMGILGGVVYKANNTLIALFKPTKERKPSDTSEGQDYAVETFPKKALNIEHNHGEGRSRSLFKNPFSYFHEWRKNFGSKNTNVNSNDGSNISSISQFTLGGVEEPHYDASPVNIIINNNEDECQKFANNNEIVNNNNCNNSNNNINNSNDNNNNNINNSNINNIVKEVSFNSFDSGAYRFTDKGFDVLITYGNNNLEGMSSPGTVSTVEHCRELLDNGIVPVLPPSGAGSNESKEPLFSYLNGNGGNSRGAVVSIVRNGENTATEEKGFPGEMPSMKTFSGVTAMVGETLGSEESFSPSSGNGKNTHSSALKANKKLLYLGCFFFWIRNWLDTLDGVIYRYHRMEGFNPTGPLLAPSPPSLSPFPTPERGNGTALSALRTTASPEFSFQTKFGLNGHSLDASMDFVGGTCCLIGIFMMVLKQEWNLSHVWYTTIRRLKFLPSFLNNLNRRQLSLLVAFVALALPAVLSSVWTLFMVRYSNVFDAVAMNTAEGTSSSLKLSYSQIYGENSFPWYLFSLAKEEKSTVLLNNWFLWSITNGDTVFFFLIVALLTDTIWPLLQLLTFIGYAWVFALSVYSFIVWESIIMRSAVIADIHKQS